MERKAKRIGKAAKLVSAAQAGNVGPTRAEGEVVALAKAGSPRPAQGR